MTHGALDGKMKNGTYPSNALGDYVYQAATVKCFASVCGREHVTMKA